jgi:hypothetical protein
MRARLAVVVPSSRRTPRWLSSAAAFTYSTKAIRTFPPFRMALGNFSLLRAMEVVENLFLITLHAVEPFSKERLVHLIAVVAN